MYKTKTSASVCTRPFTPDQSRLRRAAAQPSPLPTRARAAASAMAELALKPDRVRDPLRFSSFYELYKRFLKDHGCKWHDVAKLLNIVADVLFDVDGAFTRIAGKVSKSHSSLCENVIRKYVTVYFTNSLIATQILTFY